MMQSARGCFGTTGCLVCMTVIINWNSEPFLQGFLARRTVKPYKIILFDDVKVGIARRFRVVPLSLNRQAIL